VLKRGTANELVSEVLLIAVPFSILQMLDILASGQTFFKNPSFSSLFIGFANGEKQNP
jgi:hypothetical protein